MIRAVLVGTPGGPWRLYRQPQWMAEIRRDPAAATLSRRFFDLDEAAYASALEALGPPDRQGPDLDPLAILDRLGAVAVGPP